MISELRTLIQFLRWWWPRHWRRMKENRMTKLDWSKCIDRQGRLAGLIPEMEADGGAVLSESEFRAFLTERINYYEGRAR